MAILYKFALITLLFALTATSIQGQTYDIQYDEQYAETNDECGCAYTEGSHSAHWSVYIPITILVVAAIWFGVSDKSHHHSTYSDSQDALGSIENSKRNSDWRSGSYYSGSSNRSYGRCSHY